MTAALAAQLRQAAGDTERCAAALVRRCDEKNVHAMRVATRRARALLWSAHPWIDRRDGKRYGDALRQMASLMAAVRDLDVVARLLCSRVVANAALNGAQRCELRAALGRRRRAARRALRPLIRSNAFSVLVRSTCAGLRRRSLQSDLAAVSRARWQQRVMRGVRKFYRRLRRERFTDLHVVRIRARRLRYVLEALGPTAPNGVLQKMTEMQTALGHYCDARLTVRYLRTRGPILPGVAGQRLQRAARALARQQACCLPPSLRP